MGDALKAMAGDEQAARSYFGAAQALAQVTFPVDDLRRLTAKANLAILAREEASLSALAEQWLAGQAWLDTLKGGIRARSSTFHLRLYRRDMSGFESRAQQQMRDLWKQGLARLTEIAEPRAGAEAALDRWYRINAHTGAGDYRKLAMAAGLLLG